MKVLVTGGSGHVGSFAVARLLECGHSVRIIDRTPVEEIKPENAARIQGVEYHQVDITDFSALRPHVDGMDAIAHLAAIPHPIPGKDAEIFGINCGGSFNVYQAAADAGIKRVVSASSINALGNGYGIRNIDVKYFPIDEDHPGWTSDIYSFSKQLLEEIAAYFWRRDAISGACLRFPWVYDFAWFDKSDYEPSPEVRERVWADFEEVVALPVDGRKERIAQMMTRLEDLEGRHSRGEISDEDAWEEFHGIPNAMLVFGKNDFWTMLDARDAAQAFEKALVGDYEGSHPLWIVHSRNSLGLPSRDLASLMYADVTTWKHSIQDDESLVNIEKARVLIGYEPVYSRNRGGL